jgi:hypothetical protein
MSDVDRRLALSRELDVKENSMCDQRYAERDGHPSRPYARSFRRPDDSRREVDPCREGEHRADNGHGAGRAGICNPESEWRSAQLGLPRTTLIGRMKAAGYQLRAKLSVAGASSSLGPDLRRSIVGSIR